MTFPYWCLREASRMFALGWLSFRIEHRERMLEDGPLVVAVNHASFADPPLVASCSKRAIYFLGRKSLFSWPLLGPLFPRANVIPVERDGSDLSALRIAIRHISEGNGVTLFPEGTRSRDGNLGIAKPGVGFVIAKTRAPVQPIYMDGSFQAFPPNSKWPRRHRVTAVIGHPIYFSPEEFEGGREVYQRLSDRAMAEIVKLKEEFTARKKTE